MACAVIDCSFALAWAVDEEGREERRSVWKRIMGMVLKAPALFPFEAGNVVVTLAKKGTLGVAADKVIAELWNLGVEVQPVSVERAWTRLTKLAVLHGISVYGLGDP